MNGLFQILEKIKAKPGMYIGHPSASDLFMFQVGYKTARRELGIEPTEAELEFYQYFQPWVQRRFEVRTSNSWAKIILLFARDEKDAFECFFNLLDEFKQRDKTLDENGVKVLRSYRVRNGSVVEESEEEKVAEKVALDSTNDRVAVL